MKLVLQTSQPEKVLEEIELFYAKVDAFFLCTVLYIRPEFFELVSDSLICEHDDTMLNSGVD